MDYEDEDETFSPSREDGAERSTCEENSDEIEGETSGGHEPSSSVPEANWIVSHLTTPRMMSGGDGEEQPPRKRLGREIPSTSTKKQTLANAAAQKRDREKRRRGELNETLDDLSELVFQIDLSLMSGRAEVIGATEKVPGPTRKNTITNRTELIQCTVKLLRRLNAEIQEKDRIIAELRRGGAATSASTATGQRGTASEQHDQASSTSTPNINPGTSIATATPSSTVADLGARFHPSAILTAQGLPAISTNAASINQLFQQFGPNGVMPPVPSGPGGLPPGAQYHLMPQFITFPGALQPHQGTHNLLNANSSVIDINVPQAAGGGGGGANSTGGGVVARPTPNPALLFGAAGPSQTPMYVVSSPAGASSEQGPMNRRMNHTNSNHHNRQINTPERKSLASRISYGGGDDTNNNNKK